MTRQYRFGDRVRHPQHGEGFVTAVYPDETEVCFEVYFANDTLGTYTAAELHPVPHPDTERLNWLTKNDSALTERLCDEDGSRLDTPFAVIQKQQEHFEVLAAAADIRQAIDTAMRQKAV
ncbi:Uncharacterised protein [Kingella potus]|uniref:Uncharacterized protein n=1 Tax=Kingella potus TaxID=265175 RepID=A0A377R3K1_9NEIS|nr:hypothetical protein [Kingella potus]UOP00573.1 hypothetical protein LVJ84_12155 [Kingella potus]UOP02048.1 hypothetical protein LVJ84_14450 [Kingella potus]STR03035.1 Uncharacterised protein [Kingella potus]STR03076.1 Uncharacterised protein [Kingella potus]